MFVVYRNLGCEVKSLKSVIVLMNNTAVDSLEGVLCVA